MTHAVAEEFQEPLDEVLGVSGFIQITDGSMRARRLGVAAASDRGKRRRSIGINGAGAGGLQGVNLEIDLWGAELAFEEQLHDIGFVKRLI